MTARPPVQESVEAFAALRARLSDPFADRAAVLADHGLDERGYSGIEAAWCGRLSAGGPDALALAQAFGDAYSAALALPVGASGAAGADRKAVSHGEAFAAAGADRGAVSHGEALAAAGAPPASRMHPVLQDAAAAATAVEPAPVSAQAARPLAVPSFLKDPKPAPSVGAVSAPAPAAPSMGAPPAALAAPTAAPLAPAPATSESAGASYTGTAEVDLAALFKKSVPFHPGAKPAVPPAAPPASTGASSPAQAPKPKSDFSGETAEVDIGAIARRVLAFGPSGPAPSSQAAPPPEPPAQPAFTLDQYAVLSAEVALVGNDPAARGAVFQRFGVTNPEALLSEWRARLTADPALGGRWSAAYAHHYARLRTERGTSGGPPGRGGR